MKKFLKEVSVSFVGSLASLFFFFIFSSVGLIVIILALLLADNTPKIENQSVLVFNLDGQINDFQTETDLTSLTSNNTAKNLILRDVVDSINKASEDDRIVALYLDGSTGDITAGYGSLTEIRNALENFKNSGKKIIAYNISNTERNYFLTSVADTVALHPLGVMEMNGFVVSQLFFASALEKYGIGVQVARVGKYKSAVEPFILNNYSKESELQNQELIDDLWDSYLINITKYRSLKSGEINNIADNKGILLASQAQELNLIDQVSFEDEIVYQLKEITNTKEKDTFRQITIRDYIRANTNQVNNNNQIAVLYADGAIVDGQGRIGQVGGNRYVSEIKKIRQNNNIKGVVVRINSPGGSAIASELILRELQLLAKEKPVVVSMGDVAASGGYWIATAGEKIFATDSTITGSIGVFGLLFNGEEISRNNGINTGIVKTNKFADLNNMFKAKTEEELNIIQQSIDQIYDFFLDRVSTARNMPKSKVAEIAQGRVWTGKMAQKIGLVDEIGGLEKSLQYLDEKLGLNNNYQLKSFPEPRSWNAELIGRLTEAKINSNLTERELITKIIWELSSELDLMEILENPNKVYSILPYKLEVK